MPGEILYKFPVKGASYFPGPKYYGEGECTLTTDRLAIHDYRGHSQHLPLLAITSVEPRRGLFRGKDVQVGINGPSLVITCESRAAVPEVCRMINEAIES
jgi:hypothetical protein